MQSINYRYVNRGSYPGNVAGNTDEYVYTRLADVDVPARYVKIVIEDYVDHTSMRAAVPKSQFRVSFRSCLGKNKIVLRGGLIRIKVCTVDSSARPVIMSTCTRLLVHTACVFLRLLMGYPACWLNQKKNMNHELKY